MILSTLLHCRNKLHFAMKEVTCLFIHTKSTHLKDEMMEMQKIKKENCFMEILSDFSGTL